MFSIGFYKVSLPNRQAAVEERSWRIDHTAEIFAVVALVSAIILPKIIRNKPEDIGGQPDGDPPAQATSLEGGVSGGHPDLELTIGQALRTQAFWCISFGHGFGSMAVLAIMSHLGLLLRDMGHDVQIAGWIISVQTAVSIVFQFFGGWIGDRMPKNIALFIFTGLQGVGVIFLVLGSNTVSYTHLTLPTNREV